MHGKSIAPPESPSKLIPCADGRESGAPSPGPLHVLLTTQSNPQCWLKTDITRLWPRAKSCLLLAYIQCKSYECWFFFVLLLFCCLCISKCLGTIKKNNILQRMKILWNSNFSVHKYNQTEIQPWVFLHCLWLLLDKKAKDVYYLMLGRKKDLRLAHLKKQKQHPVGDVWDIESQARWGELFRISDLSRSSGDSCRHENLTSPP